MKADIVGALEQLDKSWRAFEHRGKPMTKEQVRKVLVYGLQKRYKNTGQLSDEEVDEIIKKFQNGDKAIVKKSVDRPDFLKHVLKEGEEVEIAERYTRWKGEEAYFIKNKTGRILTEILLAEELDHLPENKQ